MKKAERFGRPAFFRVAPGRRAYILRGSVPGCE